jgi:hypothetical protein
MYLWYFREYIVIVITNWRVLKSVPQQFPGKQGSLMTWGHSLFKKNQISDYFLQYSRGRHEKSQKINIILFGLNLKRIL